MMSRRNVASDRGPRLRSICHDVSGITGAGTRSSPRMRSEKRRATAVIGVVGISGGRSRAGVDDDCHRLDSVRGGWLSARNESHDGDGPDRHARTSLIR